MDRESERKEARLVAKVVVGQAAKTSRGDGARERREALRHPAIGTADELIAQVAGKTQVRPHAQHGCLEIGHRNRRLKVIPLALLVKPHERLVHAVEHSTSDSTERGELHRLDAERRGAGRHGVLAKRPALVERVVGDGVDDALPTILVRRAGPPFLSLVNYQVPVWAVIIGAVILNETLPGHFLMALAVILAGLFISQLGWRRVYTKRNVPKTSNR